MGSRYREYMGSSGRSSRASVGRSMSASKEMVRIEGFDELVSKIKKISSDVDKKREIRKILRAALKPTVQAAQAAAPEADRVIIRRVKGGNKEYRYEPGNLKKSIGYITVRSMRYATVEVGARAGSRKKYDGYYGGFVHEGTKYISKAVPYLDIAMKKTGGAASAAAALGMKKKVDSIVKKYSV